ncbi:MAG: hypothetical protein ACQCN3_09010 [Candidatus Bathyarchaeia archaeon]
MSHKHVIKKTRVTFIEFDDVLFNKLDDLTYFGEGNSKGRKMEYDFEYCLDCDFRLLGGKPILTKGIFDEELEKWVNEAKNGCYVNAKEITVQHSDYEVLERLIKDALALGALKQTLQKAEHKQHFK